MGQSDSESPWDRLSTMWVRFSSMICSRIMTDDMEFYEASSVASGALFNAFGLLP